MEQHQYSSPKKSQAKVGDKIRIIALDDANGTDWQAREYTGREGIIEEINEAGYMYGTWGGLGILPDIDEFEIIE